MRCPGCSQEIVVTKAGEGPYPRRYDVAECGGEGDGCCRIALMAFEYGEAIDESVVVLKAITFQDVDDVDVVMTREEAAEILYTFACAHLDADKPATQPG